MKSRYKLVVTFFIVCVFFIVNSFTVFAATGFSKKVIHPENQVGEGEALNLLMKPGQKQQVEVEIENYGDKETTILVSLSGARTNGSGVIEYSKSDFKKDKTMEYDLSDVVKVPEEVKVPAKGKAMLVLDISMPDVEFDGIITGGIQLMEKGQEENKEKSAAAINNKMAFLFGVTLFNNQKEVQPDFTLRKAYAGQENYRNAMLVDIANTQPMIANLRTLNVDITNKGKKDVLYTRKKTDISMAPNTLMTFPISLNGELMQAGEYTAHVVLKGYGKEWKWDQDFTVTDEQADKFNQSDVYVVQERGINIKLVITIVVSVLVVIIVIYMIYRYITKKKVSKKTSKKRKK